MGPRPTRRESKLEILLIRALRALLLTRDYVGAKTLPAKEGWEWYGAAKAIAEEIPDSIWSDEFWNSVGMAKQDVAIDSVSDDSHDKQHTTMDGE